MIFSTRSINFDHHFDLYLLQYANVHMFCCTCDVFTPIVLLLLLSNCLFRQRKKNAFQIGHNCTFLAQTETLLVILSIPCLENLQTTVSYHNPVQHLGSPSGYLINSPVPSCWKRAVHLAAVVRSSAAPFQTDAAHTHTSTVCVFPAANPH